MKTEILSISQMAKLLKLPHNSLLSQVSLIIKEAEKIGYYYKDLGFITALNKKEV